MSNGLTDGAITSILNHMFATGTYAKPTGLKLHLYTGDPHGAGTEVSNVVDDIVYAAQTITFADEGTTDDGYVYNSNFPAFAEVVYGSGGASYDVTHWAIKDGSGVMMAAGAMPSTVTRLAGEPMAFAIGSIYIQLERTA
jgi:hypothetical protein